MANLERIQLTLDDDENEPDDSRIPIVNDWPKSGEIQFQNLSLRYEEKGSRVVKNVNAYVQGGKKVGIVGRSGSGKSTFINVYLL